MQPDFSETTYSFSFLLNLNNTPFGHFNAVPILPSTYKEGKRGGGYDAAIIYQGYPILFQFKIPQVMLRNSRKNLVSFRTPYYRMYLNSTKRYLQHRMLLRHQKSGYLVFYTCPWFHEFYELSNFYLNDQVWIESLFMEPRDLGRLNYNEEHFVVFERPGLYVIVRSEPRKITGPFNVELFMGKISEVVEKKLTIEHTNKIMKIFFNSLIETTLGDFPKDFIQNEIWRIKEMGFFYGSEYLARQYLNCQLVLVNRRE